MTHGSATNASPHAATGHARAPGAVRVHVRANSSVPRSAVGTTAVSLKAIPSPHSAPVTIVNRVLRASSSQATSAATNAAAPAAAT